MKYFTADPHFGHENIIRLCGRPFLTVDEMADVLVDRWCAAVAVDPDPHLWVLGDVALGAGLADRLPGLLRRLPGCVHVVPGNHDRVHPARGGVSSGWLARYRSGGVVVEPLVVGLVLAGGERVVVSHFPPVGDSGVVDRFVDYRPVVGGGWLLHGHVHSAWRQRGRWINVGVDAWGGGLVSEVEVGRLIVGGPVDRGPLPWL